MCRSYTRFLKISLIIASFTLLSRLGYSQGVQVSYFGHAGYTAKTDDSPATRNQSAFNSGGLDILLTSEISERFTVLSELFAGYRGDGATSVTLSIERLYFKYAVNDYFNVRLGRMYTPIGFWQSRYSQAQFFQPTINAPYAVRTKYDKGIIPTNSVGLQIDGENIGALRFSYYFMIDNTSGASSLNTDNTDAKGITGKLKIEPLANLEIFASGRMDEILAGSTSLQGKSVIKNTKQTLLNVGLVHISQETPFEYAFEYYHVTNDADSLGKTDNDFMYAYAGYRINKVTPYVQLDRLAFAEADKYFDTNDLVGVVLGARYSIAPSAVIKLEYKYRGRDVIKNENVISLQVSARF